MNYLTRIFGHSLLSMGLLFGLALANDVTIEPLVIDTDTHLQLNTNVEVLSFNVKADQDTIVKEIIVNQGYICKEIESKKITMPNNVYN